MADELDDRIRQVFRNAASDAPRATALPTETIVASSSSGSARWRRAPLTLAAGVLLVVGIGAAVVLRTDHRNPVVPAGPVASGGPQATTEADGTMPLDPEQSQDTVPTLTTPSDPRNTTEMDVFVGERPCSATDLGIRILPAAETQQAGPSLGLSRSTGDRCAVDGQISYAFEGPQGVADGADARGSGALLGADSAGMHAVPFQQICPRHGVDGPFDRVVVRLADGTSTAVPLIGGECDGPSTGCDVDQLAISIDASTLTLRNRGDELCSVVVRDVVFRRSNGSLQRAADTGADDVRGRRWSIAPGASTGVALDQYCPVAESGPAVNGAGVVIDGYLTLMVDSEEPICAGSTEASAPAVAVCEAESLAVSVVGSGDAGEPDAIHVRLSNIGRYGDCAMPRRPRLTFTSDDGKRLDVAGPGPTALADNEPLPGDVLVSGSVAEFRIVNDVDSAEGQCLTDPPTPTLGVTLVSLELPDGTVIDLGGIQGFCSPRYSHVGLPTD